ncbi:DUF421 domain-containing protein [Clostridium omnivorum]|uniref:UPF0702 transmembrane protein YkjA n=1 Tax=Clostridium omnivorum TaxID=1604902 RepID=A0ABQ5N8I3_9CLOT|nr:DUF421 domain-containing protein [Clostridium sp. E14]GLC31345.1 UPF0702 transmembrane protein YkjA [Clostridium sp. E14]
MIDVLSYSVRVLIVYFFTYLCTRAMSKKALAEMTAYEIATIMILANVAAEPLVDKVIVKSVYGSGALVILMVLTSRLALVNKLTPALEHTATVLIKNGEIDMDALKKVSISLNQLQGLLREKGYDNVAEVNTAILEPQGTISVFPKAENTPVTLKDLNIKVQNEQLTLPLVMDGSIITENLSHIKKDEAWLINKIHSQGIKDIYNEVTLAELDSAWNLSVFKKKQDT